MSSALFRSFRAVATAALVAASAAAQCAIASGPGDPASMPRGRVVCSALWDPDGAGPAPVALVVGGSFTVGSGPSQVAIWDGALWTSLGQPNAAFSLGTTAITVWNGDLVVGVGETVYRRTGGAWLPLGSAAVGAFVSAATVFNNDLVVAGNFTTMNGTTVHGIARWNGATWSPLGAGIAGVARSLAVYTFLNQSALWVGGSFTHAGGLASNNLAVWTGSAWFATPGTDAAIHALAVRLTPSVTTSYLFLGGEFTVAGGVAADKVARYSVATNTWTNVGTMPVTSPCTSLLVRSQVSSYEVAAVQGDRVALSTGSGWNLLGPSLSSVQFLPVSTSTVQTVAYFGGRWVVGCTDGGLVGGVRSFDGLTWQTMDGVGIPRPVNTVLSVGDDLVIGGSFATISGVAVNGIARGSAGAWLPLGTGVIGGNGSVAALVRMPNGDVVAGGTFTVANGGAADHVARWNGTSWQPLGTGTSGPVRALAVLPNGDLVAGGSFLSAGGVSAVNVARWNGSGWSDLDAGCNRTVHALCVLPSGELIAGGEFDEVGPSGIPASRVARWNGAWQPAGAGVNDTVFAVAAASSASFVIGGRFTASGGNAVRYVAAWNGSNFTPVPYTGVQLSAPVRAIVALPDGSLVAGGEVQSFSTLGGPVQTTLTRSDDVFQPWGPLLLGGPVAADVVNSLAVNEAGELIAGGYFHRAGTAVSANVARLASTCPAAAATYGAGCAGSGGVNALAALSLPWEGTTLRTRATGMPAQGVVLVSFGFTQIVVPLAALLPEGGPGCELLTTPDVVLLGVPAGGVLDTSSFVSPSPSLIGVTFFQQVLALQDFGVGPLVVTSTNGLALTGGSY